jgi:hypothetical protein
MMPLRDVPDFLLVALRTGYDVQIRTVPHILAGAH